MDAPAIIRRPFAESALELAERGLAVIPCPADDGKSPRGAVSGYDRWKGCPGSKTIRRFAAEWGDANIGIITSLSGVTIADVDDAGRDVDEIIKRAGDTPLIIRTPSGGRHLWYRSNGERNANLRPSGLAVDVKGSASGIVIVPPSYRRTTGVPYVFERGSWDDLYRLPFARPGSLSVHSLGRFAPRLAVERGQRNDELFKIALREVRHCDDLESLVDAVVTINDGLPEPLPMKEVTRLAISVWGYETAGKNWAGQEPRAVLAQDTVKLLSMAKGGSDAITLFSNILVAHGARHSRGEPFAISPDAMSGTVLPWSAGRIRRARQALIELGFLIEHHHGGSSRGDPSLFRFAERGFRLNYNVIEHPRPFFELVGVRALLARIAANRRQLELHQRARQGLVKRDAMVFWVRWISPRSDIQSVRFGGGRGDRRLLRAPLPYAAL
jgi:Bifunctional DNA primase/polymerase, N-terminal/Primase C terminal 1 (PriCT-1)